MPSNVIDFPNSAKPQELASSQQLQELARSLVANFSTVSAAALCSSIDDLGKAVDKVALLVETMPAGEARQEAEASLATIRDQLLAARALSEQVRV